MSDRGLPSRTNQDQRRWAGQTLDISTSISADRVRRRALEKLAEEEFVPPESWHEALGLLLDQVAVVRPGLPLPYYNERENDLRKEVEKLAAEFFDIPPTQRRERWNKLHAFSKHWPPLRQWLEQLEPGLDTSFPALDAESVSLQKLIRLIGDAFVLPPSRRARLMLEKFPSMMNSAPFWKPIVKTLRRDFPEIAALNEPLLAELTGKHQGGKQTANTTTRRGFFSGKSNADPSNRDSLVVIWVVLAILMAALRACNSSNSRNRRVEIPRPPSVIVADISVVKPQICISFVPGGRGWGDKKWRLTLGIQCLAFCEICYAINQHQWWYCDELPAQRASRSSSQGCRPWDVPSPIHSNAQRADSSSPDFRNQVNSFRRMTSPLGLPSSDMPFPRADGPGWMNGWPLGPTCHETRIPQKPVSLSIPNVRHPTAKLPASHHANLLLTRCIEPLESSPKIHFTPAKQDSPLRKDGMGFRYDLLLTKLAKMDWPATEATPS